MTQISYNSTKMINDSLENVKTCINYIQRAKVNSEEITNSLILEDNAYLKNLPNKFAENINSLNKLSEWIVENNIKYNKICSDFEESVSNIDVITINKRVGYISHK